MFGNMNHEFSKDLVIKCRVCHESHRLKEAGPEALALMESLKTEQCLDFSFPLSQRKVEFSTDSLFDDYNGHMMGVLKCLDSEGEVVNLKAFSGQYNGLWCIPGWVDPILPVDVFSAMVAERDPVIKKIGQEIDSLSALGERSESLIKYRRKISQKFMKDIHNLYSILNFRGEEASLENLFSQRKGIPSGTGDCCAPKLLNAAIKENLKPIGLTEFYWGATNRSGSKKHGKIYSPCYEKCDPLIGYMLCGSEDIIQKAPPSPHYSPPEMAKEFFIYWDDHIVVVNKPHELLSVPGKGLEKADSVVTRVASHFSCISQPAVHRLDLETSGLMVVARTSEAHRNLSLAFQNRRVKKTYTAWLEGIIDDNDGIIELPFRLEPIFRPLQVYDPINGKMGITRWRRLGTQNQRTLVEFFPETGRTHQLRLHSSHRLGLDAPIVGDRLYGHRKPGERLMLHANYLEFDHPITGLTQKFLSLPSF